MKPWVCWIIGLGCLVVLLVCLTAVATSRSPRSPRSRTTEEQQQEEADELFATVLAAPEAKHNTNHNQALKAAAQESKLDQTHALNTSPWLKPSQQPPLPYQFLMPFVMQDGIPLVSVRIMSQRQLFVCVADTGSMHLNVGASTCSKCTKRYGSFVPTAALEASPSEQLHYGTQHDVVKQVSDAIQLHVDGRQYSTPVHVAVRRDKAVSNFNVFGMLDARDDREGMSYAILNQDSSLLVRFAEPAGYIGGVDAASAKRFAQRASIVARLIKSSAMGFYMVRLTGLWAGDEQIPTTTQLVIVDTGSNMTSFPRSTMRQLTPKLQHMQALTLELDGQAMRIQPQHLFWRGTNSLMLDDDLSVLGRNANDYMILGCYCMQGHQFLFGHETLCIAPLHFGTIELA